MFRFNYLVLILIELYPFSISSRKVDSVERKLLWRNVPIVARKRVLDEIDRGRKNLPSGHFDQICRPLRLWMGIQKPAKYCVQSVSAHW